MMHNFNFTKLLHELNLGLAEKYQPQCFAWIDETKKGAWSDLVTRFESAIKEYERNGDYRRVEESMEYYKNKCLEWFEEYKREKNLDREQLFFAALTGK